MTEAIDFTGRRVSAPAGFEVVAYLDWHRRGYSFDLPAEDYHGINAFSSSSIEALKHSPLHYKAWREQPRKQTAAKTTGELIHLAILEPAKFEAAEHYWVEPDRERNAAGSRKKRTGEQEALLETMIRLGRLIVEQEDVDLARAIAQQVYRHKLAAELLPQCRPEVTLLWLDEETGAPCKARIDALCMQSRAGRGIVDLKSTADASHDEFARSAAGYNYHAQAAWYIHAHEVVFDSTPEFFAWLAVESGAPHGVAMYLAQSNAVLKGKEMAFDALRVYADAWIRNEWLGYSQLALPLILPQWALRTRAPDPAVMGGDVITVEAKEK